MRAYNRLLMHLWPKHRVRAYFGATFDCDVRDQIQATLIHLRAWEPKTSLLFESLLQPGDLAVDIGANIGYFTLLFAKLVGAQGKVVAIEASPVFAQTVEDNLSRNGVRNARVVNAAVTEKRGQVSLFEGPQTNRGMTSIREDSGFASSITVDGMPLSDILTADEIRTAKLIKIDIEGAELPVMREITALEPKGHIAVEIADPSLPEWTEIFEKLRAKGYRAFDLGNSYDWINLIDSRRDPPAPLSELPDRQVDVLFRAPF